MAKKNKILSPAEVAKQIALRNEMFAGANPEQKRVLVASDVIAQIKANRFKPKRGVFVDVDKFIKWGEPTRGLNGDDSIQEVLISNKVSSCNTCALGGMFLSCTLFNNNVTVDSIDYQADIGTIISKGRTFSNGLNDIFTNVQLRLIELAFEKGNGWFHACNETDRKAAAFGRKYGRNDARMIAIMENIIKNHGEFKP